MINPTESKVPAEVMKKIDRIQLSERLRRLRDRYFAESPTTCTDRLKLVMESWRETQGEDIELRRAKMLQKVADHIPLAIHGGELTAGSITPAFRGAHPAIDYDAEYLKQPGVVQEKVDGHEVTFGSPEIRGDVSDNALDICREAADFFKGQTPAELMRQVATGLSGTWYEDVMELKANTPRYEDLPFLMGIPLWEKLLAQGQGLGTIIREVESNLERAKQMEANADLDKVHFWQAVIIACKAAIKLSTRYAELAREMSLKETDETRRQELEQISGMCRWVPEKPARTFQEALQVMRIVQVMMALEGIRGGPIGFGRLDQYLFPFFKKDMAEGRLTYERAAEYLGDFIGAIARAEVIASMTDKEFAQATNIAHITLGGITRDGKDACNELTYLFLHVIGLARYAEPHFTLRWYSSVTPRRFLIKALEANCLVPGIPMFINDKHMIERLGEWGVQPEFVWDWAVQGCSQAVARPQTGHYHPSHINVPLCLDLALHDGVSPISGKRVGLPTGDPCSFQTFDDVFNAFKAQYEYIFKRLMHLHLFLHQAEAMRWRYPFTAALCDGCIENGKGQLLGGCGEYPAWMIKDRGLVDVADSLTAIRKLVFEDKRLTMGELMEAIDTNFKGKRGEEIRQMCLNAPKFGNDIDEADYMVREVGKFSAGLIRSENNPFGWKYGVNRNGLAWHYAGSHGVGALPNGRRRGEPLCDGSISPMRGMDTKGPTAVANSVIKADFKEAAVAILNQKFPQSFAKNKDSLEKIALFTETLLGSGATHIQYNFIDKQVLLEAQKHPEQYKDLIVRVAGYSAYFINLTREVQDDIINRTEQAL
jgi:pyruvate-formate lyase